MSQLSQLRSPPPCRLPSMSSCNWAARNSWRATATASPATSWYVIRRPAPIAIPRPSPVWPSAKQFPEQGPLTADSFSGGEATVVPALTRLGFRIIRIGEDWSEEEVPPRSKTISTCCACRGGWGAVQQVRAQPGTAPTAERSQQVFQSSSKHQNISAVLDAWACPISTATNHAATANCCCVIRTRLRSGTSADGRRSCRCPEEVKLPGDKTYRAALVEPPAREVLVRTPASLRQRLPRKFDYAARDEANRKLGRAGEQWVIGYEQQRLTELSHPELFSGWIGCPTPRETVQGSTSCRSKRTPMSASSR